MVELNICYGFFDFIKKTTPNAQPITIKTIAGAEEYFHTRFSFQFRKLHLSISLRQLPLEGLQGVHAEPFDLKLSPLRTDKIVLDLLVGVFAYGDLHWLRKGLQQQLYQFEGGRFSDAQVCIHALY